jgi:hypothetical protein
LTYYDQEEIAAEDTEGGLYSLEAGLNTTRTFKTTKDGSWFVSSPQYIEIFQSSYPASHPFDTFSGSTNKLSRRYLSCSGAVILWRMREGIELTYG